MESRHIYCFQTVVLCPAAVHRRRCLSNLFKFNQTQSKLQEEKKKHSKGKKSGKKSVPKPGEYYNHL